MRGLLVAACGLLILSMPHAAAARPYTVVSCDSAGVFGYSSAAWEPFGNAGNAYKSCPTGGGPTAGISNRLIGSTYSAFSHSGHRFTAPPGATITHVRWAGRMARNNCRWATYIRALPSGAVVLGLPNGSYCDTTGFDNRGWPMTFAAPGGTTRLEQLVICGAAQCLPGATMHAHDPGSHGRRPDPAVDFIGRPAGERAVGERADPAARARYRERQRRRPRRHSVSGPSGAIGVLSMQLRASETMLRPDNPIDGPHRRPSRWPPFPDRFSHRRGRKFLRGGAGRLRRQHGAGSSRPASDRWRRVATHQPVWHCVDQSSGPRRSNRSSSLEDLHDRWELPFKRSARRHKYSGVAIAQSAGAR